MGRLPSPLLSPSSCLLFLSLSLRRAVLCREGGGETDVLRPARATFRPRVEEKRYGKRTECLYAVPSAGRRRRRRRRRRDPPIFPTIWMGQSCSEERGGSKIVQCTTYLERGGRRQRQQRRRRRRRRRLWMKIYYVHILFSPFGYHRFPRLFPLLFFPPPPSSAAAAFDSFSLLSRG